MATLISRDTSGTWALRPGETELRRHRTGKDYLLSPTPDGKARGRMARDIGPVHYCLDPFSDTEDWKEIDLDILLTPGQPWHAACEVNGYQVRFWNSRNIGGRVVRYIAQFRRGGKWIAMAPLALAYVNDAGQKEWIGRPRAIVPIIDNEANQITWNNAFGTGLHFRYNLRSDEFFKTVIIEQSSALPTPTIGVEGLRLVIVMAVAWDRGVRAANAFSANINCEELSGDDSLVDLPDEVVADPSKFSFLDSLDRPNWWVREPLAWDSGVVVVDGKEVPDVHFFNPNWRLLRKGQAAFLLITVPKAILDRPEVMYPVYIDDAIPETQISAGADDARNKGTLWPGDGSFLAGATALGLGADATSVYYMAGLRFLGIGIDQGDTIDTASISIKALSNDSSYLEVTIGAHNVDDEVAFAVTTHEPYDCYVAHTSATYNWVVGLTEWVANSWYGGTAQVTPNDVVSIVQEIVDRATWASGNDIGFVMWKTFSTVGGDLNRYFLTYETSGNVSGAKLNISYTPGGAPPPAAAEPEPTYPFKTWGTGWAEGLAA